MLAACEHYAGDERRLRKAMALQNAAGGRFDITADCRHSAPAGREAEHATMIGALIASPENQHHRIGLRIHDSGHRSWHGDLELVIRAAGERLAYIVIPRVDSLAGLDRVVSAIDDVALQCGVRHSFPVHVQVETLNALKVVDELAAHPRVQAMDFALAGFVAAFNGALPESALQSPGQFDHILVARAKAQVSQAAHAAGKVATHNPCVDHSDADAAYRDACRARDGFGFTRMISLHPSQIEPIGRAFAPNQGQADEACAILMNARARDWAPMIVDARLLGRAHYRYWWGVLARARAVGLALPVDVETALFRPSPTQNPRNPR